jgi:hypothetical protein
MTIEGRGNDYLDATTHEFGQNNPPTPERDLVIDCGPGKHDRARIDKIDPKPRGAPGSIRAASPMAASTRAARRAAASSSAKGRPRLQIVEL